VLLFVCWLCREDDRISGWSCGATEGERVLVDDGGGAIELSEGVGDLAPKRLSNLSFWLTVGVGSCAAAGCGGGEGTFVAWIDGEAAILPNRAKRLSLLSADVCNCTSGMDP